MNSPTAIAERAGQVHDLLLDLAPWLSEPAFLPELDRYLRASAREQLAHEGVVKAAREKGADRIPPRLLEQASTATRLASRLAEGLGLTPAGHARLKAMTGHAEVLEHTLADLQATGRAARLAAEERMALEASATGLGTERPAEPLDPAQVVGDAPEPADGRSGADPQAEDLAALVGAQAVEADRHGGDRGDAGQEAPAHHDGKGQEDDNPDRRPDERPPLDPHLATGQRPILNDHDASVAPDARP